MTCTGDGNRETRFKHCMTVGCGRFYFSAASLWAYVDRSSRDLTAESRYHLPAATRGLKCKHATTSGTCLQKCAPTIRSFFPLLCFLFHESRAPTLPTQIKSNQTKPNHSNPIRCLPISSTHRRLQRSTPPRLCR
jgi:hypothetical protein